jgi:hypothetical protein
VKNRVKKRPKNKRLGMGQGIPYGRTATRGRVGRSRIRKKLKGVTKSLNFRKIHKRVTIFLRSVYDLVYGSV